MTALHPSPDDRAFDFDPDIVAPSRPPPPAGAADTVPQRVPWRHMAGLLTAVAGVPATALILMFAAVTVYGPLDRDDPPARVAVMPLDVDATGSIGWQLRGGFPD